MRRRLGASEVVDEVEAQQCRGERDPLHHRPGEVVAGCDHEQHEQHALAKARFVESPDPVPGPRVHAALTSAGTAGWRSIRRCQAMTSSENGITVKPLK